MDEWWSSPFGSASPPACSVELSGAEGRKSSETGLGPAAAPAGSAAAEVAGSLPLEEPVRAAAAAWPGHMEVDGLLRSGSPELLQSVGELAGEN